MQSKWVLREEEQANGSELPGAAPLAEEPSVDRWGEFLQDEDLNAGEVEEQGEQPAVPSESAAEPALAESVPPSETPAVPTGQEQQTAPVAKPELTPEQVKEARQKFEDALAARYTFSEDEAVALQTEPEKVLPKLAAKLQMDVMDMVLRQVAQQVPLYVQEFSQHSQRETQAQTEFFSTWPELRGYDAQILQMGAAFRQLNPKASAKEAIDRIGKMTMDALGLTKAAPQGGPPATPSAAFRPATPGGTGAAPVAKSKWEALMDDD